MGLSGLAVVVNTKEIRITDSTEHIGERKDDTAFSVLSEFFRDYRCK